MYLISPRYPFRSMPPKDFIEKGIVATGTILRAIGLAMDNAGKHMMGPTTFREELQPSLAWAPVKYNEQYPPSKGQISGLPAVIKRPMVMSQFVMPTKGEHVFIAPNANVLGDVKIGAKSSIWYGAVLRGDMNGIEIGEKTNIQDNVTIHVARHSIHGKPLPTVVGSNCTIGHGATLHACTIEDNVLVGMGAIVLDGARVESGAMVAAGALVPPNKVVPSGTVWAGSPAKFLRNLSDEEKRFIEESAESYFDMSLEHKFENGKSFEELSVEEFMDADREELWPYHPSHYQWEMDHQTCQGIRRRH